MAEQCFNYQAASGIFYFLCLYSHVEHYLGIRETDMLSRSLNTGEISSANNCQGKTQRKWQVQNPTTFKSSSQLLYYQKHNVSHPRNYLHVLKISSFIQQVFTVINKLCILSIKHMAWTQYSRDDPQEKDFINPSHLNLTLFFFMHNLFGQYR